MTNNIKYIEKLRCSGLRPTRQRIKICEALFDPKETFHFTIGDLKKIIEEKLNKKVSLATVYNTVNAFKDKGYLKEISINSGKSYFDTNIKDHHHFFDEENHQLIDAEKNDIDLFKINKEMPGKKIKSVEVIVRLATDNQNQN